ncbi:FMN-binding negative transcriptional regulator [Phenylobacterium sp. J367]|uniref:FMN-binding negative transcriptional regulator n=1 Tax=Phenylobacterium sp. J367 TaxID=2898435 RepID=UPI002150FAAA|nr:FMN-binding negative transcriptional regulator [Phenylobacterium sp. J367]MCR5881001.1 FMN-binding negative transcriptional regulator [Phenylobacterium sp. J367]
MHPARLFHVEDAGRLVAQLGAQPFVTICAAPDGRPRVAHAPAVVRRLDGGLAVDFHLSRGNALSPFLATGFRAVAVSLGPEAYVSPDWYESPDQVPTWNYVSVEAEGPVAILDEAGLIAQVDALSAQEEARLLPKRPWTRAKMSPGVFEKMVRGIVGARLTVERLEGISKLSQNKAEADRLGVIAALGDHPVARLMENGPE